MPLALQNLIHPSLITSKELRPSLCSKCFSQFNNHSCCCYNISPTFPHAQSRPQSWKCFISIESTFISPCYISATLSKYLQAMINSITQKSGKTISLLWSLVYETWRLKLPCLVFSLIFLWLFKEPNQEAVSE